MLLHNFGFGDFAHQAFLFYVEAQPSKKAHVRVRHVHEREQSQQVAAPVCEQQLVARKPDEERGHIMREAVFAGEKVEELAADQRGRILAAIGAVFARLTEDLFVRDRPGNAGDGDRQSEQHHNLHSDIGQRKLVEHVRLDAVG